MANSTHYVANNNEKWHKSTAGCLQVCNVILILLGFVAIGLVATQFSRIGLDNYRQIDLRILGYFHCLVGLVGIYCVTGNHGSVVLKSLYVISLVISISTAVFYAVTTYRVITSYRELSQLERMRGFVGNTIGLGDSERYPWKILVSSVMIALSILTALTDIIALFMLEKLVIVEKPWQPAAQEDRQKAKRKTTQLTFVAFVKLILGLCTIGLAAFLEYEHQLLGGRDDYIKIGLDHMAALFAVASAMVDLYAVFNRLNDSLNLKVSIALSLVTAVWCLKSVDNNIFPYYKVDITAYRISSSLNNPFTAITARNYPQVVIVIVHGVLLALLAVLFFLSAITALISSSCLRRGYSASETSNSYHQKYNLQGRFVSIAHVFWTFCLLILVVLGMCDLPWNGDYVGGDLLWIAILVFSTAVLWSSNQKTRHLLKFLLNIISFSIAVEKAFVTINLIYQSAAYPTYTNENVTDRKTYVGQIILHSVQCVVLFGEAITAVNLCFSLGTIFYGAVMTASYLLFEFGKWRYSEVPLEVPFFRLGNGPLAVVVFLIQIVSSFSSQFFVASTILQVIVASLALFVISSAMTNVYYIQIIMRLRETIGLSGSERAVLIVALVLASVAVIACIVATAAGIFYSLRTLYILHHRRGRPEPPMEVSHSVVPTDQPYYGIGMLSTDGTTDSYPFRNPAVHQIAIKPVEEQTLYWSADDNPYIYKSTKRFYDQPHPIDSGYPSPYASPTKYIYDGRGYYYDDQSNGEGGSTQSPAERSARQRETRSAHTRIAHVFPEKICKKIMPFSDYL
ncbi:hypothetical protein DdX_07597 [Ditylenchus destructor]|uniref:Uncharacterized protein n=1 Tax=Ditylenchus destructor TaxID=166010 RepID=A0AAD4R1Z8_9BILA|nr:hypothetical protein DdX_07597 [Ditylenchus destructor]